MRLFEWMKHWVGGGVPTVEDQRIIEEILRKGIVPKAKMRLQLFLVSGVEVNEDAKRALLREFTAFETEKVELILFARKAIFP